MSTIPVNSDYDQTTRLSYHEYNSSCSRFQGFWSLGMQQQEAYQSYLLRMWQEDIDGEPVWRASLEHAQTAELRHFANAKDLLRYLGDLVSSGMLDPLQGQHSEGFCQPT